MKRYCKGFNFTKEFIQNSMIECLNHKTKKTLRWYRKDTSYFFAEYMIKGGFTNNSNLHSVAEYVNKDVRNNISFYKEKLVPYISECLLEEIKTQTISLKEIKYQIRVDKSSGKERKIGITSIKQQIYDYIIVNACTDMFHSKTYTFQCSSIKGRGQLYAKKYMEKWLRKKRKHSRYAVKFDIKKYYPSIRHDILFSLLERDIKNNDVLYVLKTLISTYSNNGYGLCIGTYLSQNLANYFLSYSYHYLSQNGFRIRNSKRDSCKKRVKLYYKIMYYMDDIVMLGANKRNLKKATTFLIEYLKNTLKLEIKNNTYLLIDMNKENSFIDFVGFKMYRNKTTIRRRIYKKIKQTINNVNNHIYDLRVNVAKAFMSRNGYVLHSNSKRFAKRNNYKLLLSISRRVISDESRNLHRIATAS